MKKYIIIEYTVEGDDAWPYSGNYEDPIIFPTEEEAQKSGIENELFPFVVAELPTFEQKGRKGEK